MNRYDVIIVRVVFWVLVIGLVWELWLFPWLNEW